MFVLFLSLLLLNHTAVRVLVDLFELFLVLDVYLVLDLVQTGLVHILSVRLLVNAFSHTCRTFGVHYFVI